MKGFTVTLGKIHVSLLNKSVNKNTNKKVQAHAFER